MAERRLIWENAVQTDLTVNNTPPDGEDSIGGRLWQVLTSGDVIRGANGLTASSNQDTADITGVMVAEVDAVRIEGHAVWGGATANHILQVLMTDSVNSSGNGYGLRLWGSHPNNALNRITLEYYNNSFGDQLFVDTTDLDWEGAGVTWNLTFTQLDPTQLRIQGTVGDGTTTVNIDVTATTAAPGGYSNSVGPQINNFQNVGLRFVRTTLYVDDLQTFDANISAGPTGITIQPENASHPQGYEGPIANCTLVGGPGSAGGAGWGVVDPLGFATLSIIDADDTGCTVYVSNTTPGGPTTYQVTYTENTLSADGSLEITPVVEKYQNELYGYLRRIRLYDPELTQEELDNETS